jgi:nucleoside-diphosphate-sugar epimerase
MFKPRLLIVGCGDIALRAAPYLTHRYRVFGMIRNPAHRDSLRAAGILPLLGDLDDRASLRRFGGVADAVLHFAPPQPHGHRDRRTARLLAALSMAEMLPQPIIYISTSAVYGDCGGAWVAETRAVRPTSERARRRADAEQRLRGWGRRNRRRVSILRVPGIYAPGRLPLARIESRVPALAADEDVCTSHIHADDLARITLAALHRGRPGRIYHAADDGPMNAGEYFDLLADRFGLPRPPRVSRRQAAAEIPAGLLSFLGESRRLENRRMKQELRVRLAYPTVREGIGGQAVSRLSQPRGRPSPRPPLRRGRSAAPSRRFRSR